MVVEVCHCGGRPWDLMHAQDTIQCLRPLPVAVSKDVRTFSSFSNILPACVLPCFLP